MGITDVDRLDKIKSFYKELNSISDANLREFATQLILHAPDYFFYVSATTSGKNHPEFARRVGGLVNHTKCVCFYAMCNVESFGLSKHDMDLIIIAALAHDIKKQGNTNTNHTAWEHPELAHDFIFEIRDKFPHLISKEDATIIANAVLCHMGKWANYAEFVSDKKVYPMPQTLFEYALQSADYIASRKEIVLFDFK